MTHFLTSLGTLLSIFQPLNQKINRTIIFMFKDNQFIFHLSLQSKCIAQKK
jgi:hypothetical protein